MAVDDSTLFEQWRETLSAANAADKANFDATMAFIERKTPPPTREQWEEATALRERAKNLLAQIRAQVDGGRTSG